MKRTISLLLATLMIVSLLSVFGIAVSAEGNDPATTTTYVVYEEDFDGLGTDALNWSTDDVLEALGWYIPDVKADKSIADYSIVSDGADGQALRVSTDTLGVEGIVTKSFVTVFGGDIMSLVRNGDFTLSYDLTYRTGTTNFNGYSAMIYNYNEKDGDSNGEAYGLAAVRACGTGLNGIYYPVSGGSTFASVEYGQNEGELVMSNRYSQSGQSPSLYARIAHTVGDPDYNPDTETTLQGKDLLIEKKLTIKLDYDYENGMSVWVNEVLVSEPNTDTTVSKTYNSGTWNDFLDRSSGAAVALVTDENVIADIDNIKIQAVQVGDKGFVDELPELVITEVCAEPKSGYNFAEFIEIYNPTDHPIDLRQYSIIRSNYSDGTTDDVVYGNMLKYGGYVNLGNVIGEVIYSDVMYVHVDTLRKLYSGSDQSKNTRYEFQDPDTDLNGGVCYADASGETKVEGGMYRKIKYKECWNTIYNNESYDIDAYIQPGECVVLYPMSKTSAQYYTAGVNNGKVQEVINTSGDSLRNQYRKLGLSRDTKIIAFNNFNLADEPGSGYGSSAGYRYYIGKAYYDELGANNEKVEIKYSDFYLHDATIDPYVVSYADYCPPLIIGLTDDSVNNPDSANFGKGGSTESGDSKGFSGVYVYGVDGSADYRRGTLYSSRNSITKTATAHVGKLSGAQEIILKEMYAKSDGTLAPLTITEIVPNTNNLAGEAKRAFTAIELTNTSSDSLDLYRYALVRTEFNDACTPGMGFTHATLMQAGNPVIKGVGNGAYYYFMQNHISNPEMCVLEPGESVIVWFLTEDTYNSYSRDEDFGFDYFRQYWVNQGNTQLALKGADGDYATKVIAVDGNISTSANQDNAARVFDISASESAVYGVATATDEVKQGVVSMQEVASIAVLGSAFCYYNVEYTSVQSASITYYANLLNRVMPANTSMRYIAGAAGNSKCAALARCMTMQDWVKDTANPWTTTEPGGKPRYVLHNTSAMMEPRLGSLDGEETIAILDHLFIKETDELGNITYRYFDALRTEVVTLQGAAINMSGSDPVLRFDNAVSNNVYSSLVATYGADVSIGMLIVRTEDLGDLTAFTEADLLNAGVDYQKVPSRILYRSAEYTVLSSSIGVDSASYGTSYTAIGYMTVKLDNGTVKTYWSAESTARSVTEVATAALEDVSDTQSDVYRYTGVIAEGTETVYSRYTAAVQQKLRGYAGL